MSKYLAMIGSGGHANVLAEILLLQKKNIICVVSPNDIDIDSPLYGIKHVKSDDVFLDMYKSKDVELVNGIGNMPNSDLNSRVFELFSEMGYCFASVISPYAIVSEYAQLSEGVQVMHGAIIQSRAKIGMNTLINTGAVVEHDCCIGSYNHIAPGATLSGNVVTEDHVHIGTGASIIQSIKVGTGATIGAGCSIVRDIFRNQVVVPAKIRILR
ncbi:acetyltransferase [Psychrobacter aestuarii]|uniref:Acetyltransferase n=1 Tax=Psychrobacter aestuarii TaxID=556327 RepID=A0ABP3FQ15_9GAMM|nr:acetyltransferase [Psychrobacter aestuarii]